MEFTKDIKFSNKLIGNEVVGITYSGNLFKNGSDFVSIVYGFGQNWEHTTEKEMVKTETGFTAQIEIKENFDTFNFCFRNGNYEWDNNQSSNYISGIEPVVSNGENSEFQNGETNEVTEEITETLDSDLIIEILDNLLAENFEQTTEATEKQQILDDILSEKVDTENTSFIEEFNMDELVESILNPVINFSTEEEYGLGAAEQVSEEEIGTMGVVSGVTTGTNVIKENTPVAGGIIEEATIVGGNTKESNILEDIEKEFAIAGGIIEGALDDIKHNEIVSEAEIDFDSTSLTGTTENVNYTGEEIGTGTDLITTPEDTYLVSPRKLRKFYLLTKKIKLAIYKLVVSIPKLLSGTFDEDKN